MPHFRCPDVPTRLDVQHAIPPAQREVSCAVSPRTSLRPPRHASRPYSTRATPDVNCVSSARLWHRDVLCSSVVRHDISRSPTRGHSAWAAPVPVVRDDRRCFRVVGEGQLRRGQERSCPRGDPWPYRARVRCAAVYACIFIFDPTTPLVGFLPFSMRSHASGGSFAFRARSQRRHRL